MTNLPNKNIDSNTLRTFDNNAVFTDNIPISNSEYQIILTFFQEYSGNHTSARTLTDSFIKQAKINNFDPLSIIDELRGTGGMILNSTIAAIFNAGRKKTSMLGFRQNRVAIDHVLRTVIA